MKKKYMLMGIAAVLILATMVGGTLAALNTKSEKAWQIFPLRVWESR